MTGETVSIQRLLGRREVTSLLAAFATPEVGLAVLRSDGSPFASIGTWSVLEQDQVRQAAQAEAWAPAEQAWRPLPDGRFRGYPLRAGTDAAAGVLVVRSNGAAEPDRLEGALFHALTALLEQAAAKRDVATETLDRYREINLLYRVGETIGTCLDTGTIPNLVLEESNRVIAAEAGLVLLGDVDADGHWDRYASFGTPASAALLEAVSRPLVRHVADTARSAIVTDLPAAPQAGAPLPFEAVLCVPLKVREQALGCIVLGRPAGQPVFTASDEKMLTALATQAAVAIENARLHQAELDKQRLERELQLAFGVQSSLLPRTVPQRAGWEFATWWRPAREVSGDFYDFLEHDNGRLGLVIADVADKGMPAALFMAITRSILRACTLGGVSAASSLSQANRLLCADAADGMFVTVFYAELDPATAELIYVNGGHNPPMHYRAAEQVIDELTATGIMLGFDDTWAFEECRVQVQPGDFVVFFTDGVTEAMSPTRGRFEEERLRALLLDNRDKPATEMMQAIRMVLEEFGAGQPPVDDITLVIAHRLG
jgi:serine phosphatase RsbU (regulator of sigma subunit)